MVAPRRSELRLTFLYDGRLRPVAWLDGAGAVKAPFVS